MVPVAREGRLDLVPMVAGIVLKCAIDMDWLLQDRPAEVVMRGSDLMHPH